VELARQFYEAELASRLDALAKTADDCTEAASLLLQAVTCARRQFRTEKQYEVASAAICDKDPRLVSWREGDREKIGRFSTWAKRLGKLGVLPPSFNWGDIEPLATFWGQLVPQPVEIQLYQGKALVEQYQAFDKIPGLRSCLTGVTLSAMFDLFVLNPDRVQLAVAYANELPLARALLWDGEALPKDGGEWLPIRAMDQSYYCSTYALKQLHSWVCEQGWMYFAASNAFIGLDAANTWYLAYRVREITLPRLLPSLDYLEFTDTNTLVLGQYARESV
jgi:hypothetical protein